MRYMQTLIDDYSNGFYKHGGHIQQILAFLYKVSQKSRNVLFDFGKSDNTPPIIPPELMKKFRDQAELKRTESQANRRRNIFQKQNYRKDMYGFVMTNGGMYETRFWGGEVYFKHSDGYHVNGKLAIKIWEDS